MSSPARARGAGDRVRFAGVQPEERVIRYMQAADLLVIPSRNEGTPNVLREALGCGLPVVATAVGGIPAVLDAPFLGRLVAPGDVMAMAAALEGELAAPHDPQRIHDAARRFSWPVTVSAYLEVLEDAVRRGPP